MASVKRRPNGKWRARFRDSSGREHARHFRTQSEAQSWLDQQTADIVRGEWIDPRAGRLLFGEYASRWHENQPHRPSTKAQIDSHFRNHLLPAFGTVPLADIRPSDVQSFVTRLSDRLAPSTIEVIHSHLSSILSSAVDDGLIVRNPARRRGRSGGRGVRLPERNEVDRKVVPIDFETASRLIDSSPDGWRAMVVSAVGLGMRQGELLGLTVDRIDFLRRVVTVDRQLVTTSEGAIFGPPKTKASVRTIPLPEVVSLALAEHLRVHGTGEHGLLFTTSSGGPMPRNRFGEVWRGIRRKADLEVRFHDLRHLYASALIHSGESVKVVQHRLGHATAVETLDTYGHLWPDDDEGTRSAIDALFRKSGRALEAV